MITSTPPISLHIYNSFVDELVLLFSNLHCFASHSTESPSQQLRGCKRLILSLRCTSHTHTKHTVVAWLGARSSVQSPGVAVASRAYHTGVKNSRLGLLTTHNFVQASQAKLIWLLVNFRSGLTLLRCHNLRKIFFIRTGCGSVIRGDWRVPAREDFAWLQLEETFESDSEFVIVKSEGKLYGSAICIVLWACCRSHKHTSEALAVLPLSGAIRVFVCV
jgi:hypothetical protein